MTILFKSKALAYFQFFLSSFSTLLLSFWFFSTAVSAAETLTSQTLASKTLASKIDETPIQLTIVDQHNKPLANAVIEYSFA